MGRRAGVSAVMLMLRIAAVVLALAATPLLVISAEDLAARARAAGLAAAAGRAADKAGGQLPVGADAGGVTVTHGIGDAAAPMAGSALSAPAFVKIVIEAGGAARFEGTGTPGSEVTLTLDQQEVGRVAADARGRWTLAVARPLSAGDHRVTSTATSTGRGRVAWGQDVRIAIPADLIAAAAGTSVVAYEAPAEMAGAVGPAREATTGGATDGAPATRVAQQDGARERTETGSEAADQRRRAEDLARAASEKFSEVVPERDGGGVRTVPAESGLAGPEPVRTPPVLAKRAEDGFAAPVLAWLERSAEAYQETIVRRLSDGALADGALPGSPPRPAGQTVDRRLAQNSAGGGGAAAPAPPAGSAQQRPFVPDGLSDVLTDTQIAVQEWLARANRTYQTEIVRALEAPRAGPAAVAGKADAGKADRSAEAALRAQQAEDERRRMQKAAEEARRRVEDKAKEAAKAADAKPAEPRPAETKPAQAKPAEQQPVEAKPAESKAADAKPAERKAESAASGAQSPVAAAPAASAPDAARAKADQEAAARRQAAEARAGAEKERLAQAQAEADKAGADKARAEKAQADKAQSERAHAEKAAAEKAAAEKAKAEQQAKAAAERQRAAELERAEAARKASAEAQARDERRLAEQKRLDEEAARARAAAERAAVARQAAKKEAAAAAERQAADRAAAEAARKLAADDKARAEAAKAAESARLAEAARKAAAERRLGETAAAAEARKADDAARAADLARKAIDAARSGPARRAAERALAAETDKVRSAAARAETAEKSGAVRAEKARAAAKAEKPAETRIAEGSGEKGPVDKPRRGESLDRAQRSGLGAGASGGGVAAEPSAAEGPRCRRAGRRITPPGTYVVKDGDTLSEIVEAHYGGIRKLGRVARINRRKIQDPDLIRPCQRIRLP